MQNIVDKKRELIGIVNSAINKAPLPEVKDWEKAFTILKRHSLGSIFYIAVKDSDKVPKEIKEKAKSHFTAQTAQQMSQDYYTDVIYREFTKRKIKFMPIKGVTLRDLYPMPEMRTSCDIDIFYDYSRKKEVFAFLRGLGFEQGIEGGSDTGFTLGAITLEMHHLLTYGDETQHKYYKDVWNRLTSDDGVRYNFTAEDFYVYFLAHSSKHFLNGGFGIRTVLDIYLYRKKVDLNQEYLDAELEKLSMLKFAKLIEKLSAAWFEGGEIDDETQFVEEFILSSATYGTGKTSVKMREAKLSKNARKAKYAYLFNVIFPSYKDMKSRYKILRKLPFLLPFAWVYKWFEVLFTRRHKFKVVVKSVQDFDETEFENTQKIIKITGLGK